MSMYAKYYDIDGHPIGVARAEELLGDIDARRVALTEVGERTVSTVHLVLDHSFTDDGPPVLFETMAFPECAICVRTPTKEAALAMHDQVVAELKAEARAAASLDA